MNKLNFIILICIINLLLIRGKFLTCGEEQINNCKECGKDSQSNSCTTCQVEHFPLLENLLCIPCDDPIYGQAGCEGECDSSKYSQTGFISCQKCKEGYYNLEGLCYTCNTGSPGCKECTYEKEEGSITRFKCSKCLNDEEYRIDEDFKCVKCNDRISNCKKCHYIGETGYNVECDECNNGYYLDSYKQCSSCGDETITGGYCHKCSPGSKPDYCWCQSGYTLFDYSCKKCPSNCDTCKYNSDTDSTKCSYCKSGYGLNSAKDCIYCGDGCSSCNIDSNNNPICLECHSDTFLEQNKCLVCSTGCDKCKLGNGKIEPVCTKCQYRYAMDPETNKCNYCSNIKETGNGCDTCIYNISNKRYECQTCIINGYSHNYVYVQNTFQCFSNQENDKIGLYGCITALYNETTNKYICLNCKNSQYDGYFIPVITDKSCTEKFDNCLEAERKEEGISCSKCSENYALIEDVSNHLKTCRARDDYLVYCLEGKLENGIYSCTKCVNNSQLVENKCSCNSDSFSKDTNWCYKCNDFKQGNPGCDESFGCTYYSANQELDCNKCKEGYFEATQGQCLLCSSLSPNCYACQYNNVNEALTCDNCINNIYRLNEENKCELNECEEYSEISPGCIICKEKLEEYKTNKKCQRCKYGYFKTKDEKCIYCNSEKNGGHACSECQYEKDKNGKDTDNIICKECYPSNSYFGYLFEDYYDKDDRYNSNQILLSSQGKCYDCQVLFSDKCNKCDITKNKEGKESLQCVSCIEGYYLSSEGICLSFNSLLPEILNCRSAIYSLGEIEYSLNIEEWEGERRPFYYFEPDIEENKNIFVQTLITSGMKKISFKCKECFGNSFLSMEGNCEELTFDKCSFNSIFKNFDQLKKPCSRFCEYSYNNKVEVVPISSNNKYYYLGELENYMYDEFIENFGKNNNIKSCLSNTGEDEEYAPEAVKHCIYAFYYQNNNTYKCVECQRGYYLVDNICSYQKNKNEECIIENIGNEILPIYSCRNNYYNRTNYTLIKYENNNTEFVETKGDLEGCAEAVANTTFKNSKYNCTKCTFMYVPYYNKFYDRIICQSVKNKIKRENDISLDLFYENKNKINSTNGQCEKEYLFTIDGKYCFRCDDETIGMPGCKGGCDFSLYRNRILKCKGECKEGYIESSEGICSSCNSISKGCHECHYENEYPDNYKGPKRKRRFVCDYCEDGFMQSLSGECLDCENLGLNNCSKCELSPTNLNNYICTQCLQGFFVNVSGECDKCDITHFKGKSKNKCFKCDNTLEGGIENCLYCESHGDKTVCKECAEGYILSTTDNICLPITKNKDVQKFINCLSLIKKNNQYECEKCKEEFSLININNKNECVYIKTLFDPRFKASYSNDFYTKNNGEVNVNDFYMFVENDYIYNRYKNYYPCQEAENLGTEDNPLYSCKKCYESINKESNKRPVKITEESSKASYCINQSNYEELKDCTAANYNIKNGKEIFNCTECRKDYALTYNKYASTYYCKFTNATTKCIVLYCKICNPFDGYICEECLPDYSINSLSGSCVKKTEVVPAVTWKDIYRLNMNGVKTINNRYIHGPSLVMRGITSSQINTRHAFLVYLTFQVKFGLRNLDGNNEEDIKIPTICEVVKGVDETSDDVNMVDYECIGNQTSEQDLTNYKLSNIQEGNDRNLKESNLNSLIEEIKEKNGGDLDKLQNAKESSFTYEDLAKIVVFKMNEKIKSLKADDFKFNIKIDGKLSKDIPSEEITREFEMTDIDTKANCKFSIGSNKAASLSCDLNTENHKNIKSFSFKTSEIITNENEIYLAKFNDIILLNSEEDDNKTLIIVVSVVCSVVGAAGIGIGIYCIIKRYKAKKANLNIEENKEGVEKIDGNNNKISDNYDSGNRMISFKN